MLEKKKNKGIVKLGNNNSTMVVSHKQGKSLNQYAFVSNLTL